MRASSRLFLALALATILLPRAAVRRHPSDPTGARTVELVHGFWNLVSDVRGEPGAPTIARSRVTRPGDRSAADGEPPVALNDLSKPTDGRVAAPRRAAPRERAPCG